MLGLVGEFYGHQDGLQLHWACQLIIYSNYILCQELNTIKVHLH